MVLKWKRGVLNTGPPRKSTWYNFWFEEVGFHLPVSPRHFLLGGERNSLTSLAGHLWQDPTPKVLLAPQSLSVGEGSLKPGGQHAVSSSKLMLSSNSAAKKTRTSNKLKKKKKKLKKLQTRILLYYKIIKMVWCWHKNRHRSTEQDIEPRNKHMHIWSINLQN